MAIIRTIIRMVEPMPPEVVAAAASA
jgi:hypothetical protein